MEPGRYYHIYTHANGSENLFRTDENFRYFLKRYEAFIPGVAKTLVYCLMPNHLHLLVRVKTEPELVEVLKEKYPEKLNPYQDQTGFENLSGLTVLQFSHLFNAYSKAYNKMYKRRGSLFNRAFKRKEITSDEYLTRIIQYIHNNPVHHRFTSTPASWPWSSFHAIAHATPSFVAAHDVIQWFGNAQNFLTFHNQLPNPNTLTEIQNSLAYD
ncbi:MAG: hypothetical protein KF687_06005 [Cyclobacteriaceae bacterium]|nr:hypothetical protein [Cyclobacteriaceae bacterium]